MVLEAANAPWAIKDIPVEEPGEGLVLIKTEACGVCHSVRCSLNISMSSCLTQNPGLGPATRPFWTIASTICDARGIAANAVKEGNFQSFLAMKSSAVW